MSDFRIGASYYPEWWSEKDWEEDFTKMEALGFNTVRMGEFAWSWYEPREGEYNFKPMIKAVDCAQKHNIKVIMGTTTAVAPPWLYKKYPGIKGGNENGHYDFGGRKGQCLSSKIFLEYAEKITREQAKALGNHPNIIGWQLDNEPGFPFCDYDENCNNGFREWLKNKYKTIDNLNKAWFSMMFSNMYTNFDEINIPVNACEGGWQPEIQLDYRKYFSFTFNRLLKMEADIIREFSPGRFLYTNWPGANWSVNCFEGSKYLDYAAWDNYVPQPHGDNYRVQLRASMEHSFDRRLSNGKERFIVAEQKGLTDANSPADIIRAQTWLNVSHGAFATIYFEWRSPKGGPEQAYESVLGKDKKPRPETEPIFKKLTSELKAVYPLIDEAKTKSDVALIYSYENSWGTPGWVVDGFYDEDFFNCYGGFKNALNTNIDVIGIDDDFSRYKVIILPNHRITTEKQAEKIEEFAKNGGIIILNTETGTREETNQMRELLDPGLFSKMCGAEVTGTIASDEFIKQTGEKCKIMYEDGSDCTVYNKINRIRCAGSSVVATYVGGMLGGSPAVTINGYGNGYAILYGTDGNSEEFYEVLANYIKTRFIIEPLLNCDDGIILSSRVKDNKEYIFVINMKDTPQYVDIPEKMTDELSGKEFTGKVLVRGYGVLMLRSYGIN